MGQRSDQSFVDIVAIVIGVLVLFAVVIGGVAFFISDHTVGVSKKLDPDMRAALTARIAPIGNVQLKGQEATARPVAAAPAPAPVPVAEAPAPAKSGEQVYNMACVACHASGIAGSPKLGDADAWAARIAQGMDVLADHAINGYTGEAGVMPAKGGLVSLSDEEVVGAIQYIIDQSQ